MSIFVRVRAITSSVNSDEVARHRTVVRTVDQHRLVRVVRVALGSFVELLLQKSLVYRRDGPLRPSVHAPVDLLGRAEGVLGHRAADAARDPLGAEGDLV